LHEEYDVLLSPHPDDLVYSAYTMLSDRSRHKLAITFFNVSTFTRFGLLPRRFVTLARTFEDLLALGIAGCRVRFLYEPDSVARGEAPIQVAPRLPDLFDSPPSRVVAPLGVGGNPDHVIIRGVAMSLWRRAPECELVLYEDLPYAARSADLAAEEMSIVSALGEAGIREEFIHMSPSELRRKLLLSRLYVTQTGKARTLLDHARRVGADSGEGFAERFFVFRPAVM
jgi:LmbE family N-acetylglucosaminyl deacetylase